MILYNRIMSNANTETNTETAPVIGEGATYTVWTDSHAGTVVKISPNGKTAWIQLDKATLLNGHNSNEADKLKFSPGGFMGHTDGNQRYSYERDPNGEIIKATYRAKLGIWKIAGHATRSPGGRIRFGVRRHYHDFNF